MRLAIVVAVAVLFASSCLSVQTRTTGTLIVEPIHEAPVRLHYEAYESHSTAGLAIACVVTAVFYGGACWAYLGLPFATEQVVALEHARSDAVRIGRCAAVVDLVVEGNGFSDIDRFTIVKDDDGRTLSAAEVAKLCPHEAPPPPPSAPPPLFDPASS